MTQNYPRLTSRRHLASSPSVLVLVNSLFSVLAIVFWCSGSAGAQETPDISRALKLAAVSAPLTDEEKTTATGLAQEALQSAHLFAERKMYLTDAQISRDTALEMRSIFGRRVMLTYYRYEGDLSIQVLIDLTARRVLEVKPRPHFFSPISVAESELAKQLALDDPRLSAALAPFRDRLVIEALTLRMTLPKDPLFRHRVVHLLFRSGSTYLMRTLRVLVDLTTEKVIVEPAPDKSPM